MPVIIPVGESGSFTEVVVTGSYTTENGQPAQGTLTFTLSQPMANGMTVPPSPITVTLREDGSFTVNLLANDDAATVPQGVRYGVTEQINGAQPRDYFVVVSHDTSPVDIATLMPGEGGWT
jgi:hypothetical protein